MRIAALAAALALLSMQAASGGYDNGNGDASKVAAMAAHRRSDVYVAADLPDGVSDASTISCSPDDLMCEYSGHCRCAEPGCYCRVKWGHLPYGRLDTAAVEVAVNVSCASLRRPGSFLNSVRIGANGAGADRPIELVTHDTFVEMSRDVPQCFQAGEHPLTELQASDSKPVPVHWEWEATAAAANKSVACARQIRLIPARTVDELAGVKLTSFSIGNRAWCSPLPGETGRRVARRDRRGANALSMPSIVREDKWRRAWWRRRRADVRGCNNSGQSAAYLSFGSLHDPRADWRHFCGGVDSAHGCATHCLDAPASRARKKTTRSGLACRRAFRSR